MADSSTEYFRELPLVLTVKVWRLVHKKWVDTALSGIGASMYPGRWNKLGQKMVYLSSSLALAALETRVHLEITSMEQPYVALEIEIPENEIATLPILPKNWKANLKTTQAIGSSWFEKADSLALFVPSSIIPEEVNILLNPLHANLPLVKTVAKHKFEWDDRLF